MTLVGRNDNMPGVEPAHDWAELKQILSRHRFFVHTADPNLEDGYNMATLEAMAERFRVPDITMSGSQVFHSLGIRLTAKFRAQRGQHLNRSAKCRLQHGDEPAAIVGLV